MSVETPDSLGPLLICDEQGRETVNPARLAESAIWLRAENYPLVIAAGKADTTQWRAPRGRSGVGGIVVHELVAGSNVPFLCTLQESAQAGGWKLSNAPIHHNLMFGKGPKPFRLARPLYIPPQSFLELDVTSRASALDSAIDLVAKGRWVRAQERYDAAAAKALVKAIADEFKSRDSRPFWLTDDKTFTTLTALQSGVDIYMTMPNGLRLASGYLLIESDGPVQLEIFEYENGDRLTIGGPINSDEIAGDGYDPAETPGAVITEPTEQVHVKATDLSGASNTVFLSWHGVATKARIEES